MSDNHVYQKKNSYCWRNRLQIFLTVFAVVGPGATKPVPGAAAITVGIAVSGASTILIRLALVTRSPCHITGTKKHHQQQHHPRGDTAPSPASSQWHVRLRCPATSESLDSVVSKLKTGQWSPPIISPLFGQLEPRGLCCLFQAHMILCGYVPTRPVQPVAGHHMHWMDIIINLKRCSSNDSLSIAIMPSLLSSSLRCFPDFFICLLRTVGRTQPTARSMTWPMPSRKYTIGRASTRFAALCIISTSLTIPESYSFLH